jgi:peptidoglycan/LPS O-acetylase OafA/YrhL
MAIEVTTAAQRPSPEDRAHTLPALTGVRFLAAFYVVLEHGLPWLAARWRLPSLLATFLASGYLAVSMFFLLSGFILTYTYRGLQGGENRLRFWRARFARIYPVYVLSLLLALPFEPSLGWGAKLSVLAMVQAWNPWKPGLAGAWNFPAWTLSVEAFFYLCFPFLLFWLKAQRGRNQLLLLAFFGAVCVLGRTPLQGLQGRVGEPPIAASLPLPVLRLPEFVLGMLVGLRFLRRAASIPENRSPWIPVALASTTLALLSLPIGEWKSLVVVPFGFLVYELALGKDWCARLLSTRPMILLGGASYAVYLLQYPVRSWVRIAFARFPQPLASQGAPLTPVILVLLSILIFKYWEEPARRFIRGTFAIRSAKRKAEMIRKI